MKLFKKFKKKLKTVCDVIVTIIDLWLYESVYRYKLDDVYSVAEYINDKDFMKSPEYIRDIFLVEEGEEYRTKMVIYKRQSDKSFKIDKTLFFKKPVAFPDISLENVADVWRAYANSMDEIKIIAKGNYKYISFLIYGILESIVFIPSLFYVVKPVEFFIFTSLLIGTVSFYLHKMIKTAQFAAQAVIHAYNATYAFRRINYPVSALYTCNKTTMYNYKDENDEPIIFM